MIHTNRIVTVGEQESIIDGPIVLYRGDREVEIEFTLVGNEFTFSEEGNVIKSVNASHGQLVLNTPSGEHMFSELAECHEGKVVFVVTKEMIDELIEVGFYNFQIRLYDSVQMKSRVTIPPVLQGFDIRNPIAAEDETNVSDLGVVDYSRVSKDEWEEDLPTFDWQGNYNKTDWQHHDVIYTNKLNKIEDALYSINANVIKSDEVMLNTLDRVKKDADKYVKEHMAEVEADVEEFERNLNTGVEQFKIDTNAAMTAHKNEVSEELEGFSSELENVNTQLAHIPSKTCKDIGMVSLDEDSAVENLNKLLSFLNKGYEIIIDGIYYLSGENQTYNIENVLLTGSNGELILKDNFTIVVQNNSIIKNVKINLKEGIKNTLPLFTVNANVKNIIFDGLTSESKIHFFECNNSGNENNITIDNIEIKNSNLDCPTLGFYTNNISCNKINVRNNILHNIEMPSFNFNYTNCPFFNIESNICYNDIDFFATESLSYLCMILTRGQGGCYYKNNVVRGLKTTRADVSVYDAYLSYRNVYASNNTWEDNVNIAGGNNALFYAKGGVDSTDEEIEERHVVNNKYTITNELINSLTPEQIDGITLVIYNFDNPVKNFTFNNNIIDTKVIKLQGNGGRVRFRNMSFDFCTVRGALTTDLFRLAGHSDSTFTISNNIFESTNTTSNVLLLNNTAMPDDANKIKSITVNNNYMKMPFENFVYNSNIETLNFNNNFIINSKKVTTCNLFRSSKINNLVGIGNIIKTDSSAKVLANNLSYDNVNFEITEDLNITASHTKTETLKTVTKGCIVFDEHTTSSFKVFSFFYNITGDGNITYSKDGVSITEPYDSNKYPFSDNKNIYINMANNQIYEKVQVGKSKTKVRYMIE